MKHVLPYLNTLEIIEKKNHHCALNFYRNPRLYLHGLKFLNIFCINNNFLR